MSYDLAVWEGERPADNAAAAKCFADLYDRYMDTEPAVPPVDRITAFVAALLERWPDPTENDDEDSPWSAGPMSWSRAEEASAYAAEVAASLGLVDTGDRNQRKPHQPSDRRGQPGLDVHVDRSRDIRRLDDVPDLVREPALGPDLHDRLGDPAPPRTRLADCPGSGA
ncbi:hypothetical protein [Embleya scabrispora]|uniref:hypothetical protein n=1 Tax=Embleya scabrispora TaxID=159449 RepID=UPI00035D135D